MTRPSLLEHIDRMNASSFIELLSDYCETNTWDKLAAIDLMAIMAKCGMDRRYKNRMDKFLNENSDCSLAFRLHGKYLAFIEGNARASKEMLAKAENLNPDEPSWVKYIAGTSSNYYEQVHPKVLYTAIPKNGSSTIKNYYSKILNSPSDNNEGQASNPHAQFGNPYFTHKTLSERDLEHSFKFAILRDPIERIYSYYSKNIIEEKSLASELGNTKKTRFYGLDLMPSPTFFVDNFWRYVFCFNDVLHHCCPQSAYSTNPKEYNYIGSMEDIHTALNKSALYGGFATPANKQPERLMISSNKSNNGEKETFNRLKAFYRDDYDLLSGNLDHHGRAPSFINNKEKADIRTADKVTKLEKQIDELYRLLEFTTKALADTYAEETKRIKPPKLYYPKILEAINSKSPFSIVRMGDGEGLFLCDDTISSRLDIKAMSLIQFGCSIDEDIASNIRLLLLDSLKHCDVLGIPSRNRHLLTNPRSRVQRGIIGVYSALKYMKDTSSISLTSADIHIQMHQDGILDKILTSARKVTLITGRKNLGKSLSPRYPATEINSILIPCEHKYRDPQSLTTCHLDVYKDILKSLRKDLRGEIFLVAGGLLGKAYCQQIKSSGGIAIDIGSIADLLSGNASRPYIANTLKQQPL